MSRNAYRSPYQKPHRPTAAQRRPKAAPDLRIEFPSRGKNFTRFVYGVYEYTIFPAGHPLAGLESRSLLAEYPHTPAGLAQARAEHAAATIF